MRTDKKKPVDTGFAGARVHIPEELAWRWASDAGSKDFQFGHVLRKYLKQLNLSEGNLIEALDSEDETGSTSCSEAVASWLKNRRLPPPAMLQRIERFLIDNMENPPEGITIALQVAWRMGQAKKQVFYAGVAGAWERAFDLIDEAPDRRPSSMTIIIPAFAPRVVPSPMTSAADLTKSQGLYTIHDFVKSCRLGQSHEAIVRFDEHLRFAVQEYFSPRSGNANRILVLRPSGPSGALLESAKRIHQSVTVRLSQVEVLYVERPQKLLVTPKSART